MPKVLYRHGFSVIIYTNDHQPAHVHVMTDRGEAKIQIAPRVRLLVITGRMSRAQVKRALRLVENNHDLLQSRWNGIHGKRH